MCVWMQGCGFCCFNLFKAEEREISTTFRDRCAASAVDFRCLGETAVRLCCFVTIGDVHCGDFCIGVEFIF